MGLHSYCVKGSSGEVGDCGADCKRQGSQIRQDELGVNLIAGGDTKLWPLLQQTQDDRELFRGLSCSCQESRASSKRAVKTSLLGIMLEAKPEGSGLSYHFYPQL